MTDEKYMKLALKNALKGTGKVNPNPLVGALIVKDGQIIGEGFHEEFGGLHAERNALKNCGSSLQNATMYVTLEPCCHYGKTPPCTDAIIESGIKRVVIGTLDPNDKVAGKGAEILRNAGISVTTGILEDECKEINQVFFHYIQTKTPYVVLKYAMTLDGKIATYRGRSKWISGEKSRQNVHHSRNKYMAIMAGVNTVLVDDPELTSRTENSRNPIRIICDSTLKTPFDSKILKTAKQTRTILATLNEDEDLCQKYRDLGAEIIHTKSQNDKICLKDLMQELGALGIDSILLEGGSALNFSALDSEIVNKTECYIAPKIFGGEDAKTPIGGQGFSDVLNKVRLANPRVSRFDEDIFIESEVFYVHRDN